MWLQRSWIAGLVEVVCAVDTVKWCINITSMLECIGTPEGMVEEEFGTLVNNGGVARKESRTVRAGGYDSAVCTVIERVGRRGIVGTGVEEPELGSSMA